MLFQTRHPCRILILVIMTNFPQMSPRTGLTKGTCINEGRCSKGGNNDGLYSTRPNINLDTMTPWRIRTLKGSLVIILMVQKVMY